MSVVEVGRLRVHTVVVLVLLSNDHVPFGAPGPRLAGQVAVVMLHIVADVVTMTTVARDRLQGLVPLAVSHVLVKFVLVLVPRRRQCVHAWFLTG